MSVCYQIYFDYSSNLAFTFFHAWESKRKHSFMVSVIRFNRLMGMVKLAKRLLKKRNKVLRCHHFLSLVNTTFRVLR